MHLALPLHACSATRHNVQTQTHARPHPCAWVFVRVCVIPKNASSSSKFRIPHKAALNRNFGVRGVCFWKTKNTGGSKGVREGTRANQTHADDARTHPTSTIPRRVSTNNNNNNLEQQIPSHAKPSTSSTQQHAQSNRPNGVYRAAQTARAWIPQRI